MKQFMPKYNFWKYQAVGNAYTVVDGLQRQVCSPIYGVGGDGVLREHATQEADFGVEIINPDGSSAETSGNGLRIFAYHLWQTGRVALETPFTLMSAAGRHLARILPDNMVELSMGRPNIIALDEPLTVGGVTLLVNIISMGNPHCVLILDTPPDEATTRMLGAQIERHPRFPQRTNVQFVFPVDRRRVVAQVWERGAGYTLSSGSSSCAVAAVVRAKGLSDDLIEIEMPGGHMQVTFLPDHSVQLRGAVHPVASGQLHG
jgi:diaminopimelate epimerase